MCGIDSESATLPLLLLCTTVKPDVWDCVYLWFIDVIIFLCKSVSGDLLEGLLYIDGLLRTCLKVRNVVLRLAPVLGPALRHLTIDQTAHQRVNGR